MESLMQFFDVIIVGSGLAGLFTALNLNPSLRILILQKTTSTQSNSMLAQGGIAAELTDDPKLLQAHIDDTLKAGSYLNNPKAVELLVKGAKQAISTLIALGTQFDRDLSNVLLVTKEGGHSTNRILHSGGDASGYHTTKSLLDGLLKRSNVTILENAMAVNVLKDPFGSAIGMSYLYQDGYHAAYAKQIVLATGGIGSVYGSTTNDLSSTGDGIGIAHRAGAIIAGMEFVQFHPTALYEDDPKKRQRFLISEAVRGEGAWLLNVSKERFMTKYDPERMELAPRDVVSQAIYREMYDTWTDHVFLDTCHLDPKYLERRFPTIFRHCKEEGYIMGIDLIPVAPCEHFSCGGIVTDIHGRTSVPHLFAVGEVASTGVHGANRLASNSLLECLVFGMQVATAINESPISAFPSETALPNPNPVYNYNYKPIRKKVGDYMDDHVGIVRNTEGLKLTIEILNKDYQNLLKYPNYTVSYFETLNLVTTAKIITEQALARKESIGCHLRIK
jgi:L-aspartate oxidase